MMGKNLSRRFFLAAALLGGLVAASAAWAQDSFPESRPAPPAPTPPGTGPHTRGQAQENGSGNSLSKELSRSNGIIKPPPTGDGKTIPPPGTPGGDPDVVPK